MKEIEIGWYVRTKHGIFKIVNITRDLGYNKKENRIFELNKNIPEEGMEFIFYKDSPLLRDAEFSNNVIDIIKVGDYVNEEKVLEVLIDRNMSRIKTELSTFFNDDIKSIVTKEYFERGKYILGL